MLHVETKRSLNGSPVCTVILRWKPELPASDSDYPCWRTERFLPGYHFTRQLASITIPRLVQKRKNQFKINIKSVSTQFLTKSMVSAWLLPMHCLKSFSPKLPCHRNTSTIYTPKSQCLDVVSQTHRPINCCSMSRL